MATINEIADILAERSNRTLDFAFKQELKVIINNWGVLLLKKSLDKRPQDRRYFLQHFNTNLIKEDKVNCPFTIGCNILRTELQIPSSIRSNNIIFDYVGSPNKEEAFSFVYPEQLKYLNESCYTGNKTRYSYINGYIYIFNNLALKYIGIRGIFTDLKKLDIFKCDDQPCYSDNEGYIIPDDLVAPIIQSILANELRNILPQDEHNIELAKNANE